MARTERCIHERRETRNFLTRRNVLTVQVQIACDADALAVESEQDVKEARQRSPTSMQRIHRVSHKLLFLMISLATLLAFVLAACGSTGAPGSGSGPTPTPTPTQGYGTAHGCPSDTVVTPTPPAAKVTVKLSDANATFTVQVGDVIEVQLPFGLRWTGPAISGSGLQLQTPAGYASTATGMCIWRFHALHAGTTHLTFWARAICQPGQVCPHFVLAIPFTMVVK